jgi:hypothetical protein
MTSHSAANLRKRSDVFIGKSSALRRPSDQLNHLFAEWFRAATRERSELMKNLSRLLLAPTLAVLLLLACTPTNAAHRGGGSAYDGTWSVAIYTLRGDCGSVRVAVRIVGGRVYSADQSYQSNGAVGANGVVRVSVAGAGRSATGSGRLSHNSGAGRWWSSRGECSGSWSASRRAGYY